MKWQTGKQRKQQKGSYQTKNPFSVPQKTTTHEPYSYQEDISQEAEEEMETRMERFCKRAENYKI